MTTHPEALRLAELIENDYGPDWSCFEAAAELRRLYWSDLCAIDAIRQLRAENKALRADAERYRYLRNRKANDVLDNIGLAAGVWIDCEDESETLILLTGDDADAAIDAARSKT